MSLFTSLPARMLVLAATIGIVGVGFVVVQKNGASAIQKTTTWGSGLSALYKGEAPGLPAGGLTQEELSMLALQEQFEATGPYLYAPPERTGILEHTDTFDFAAFLASLSGDTSAQSSTHAKEEDGLKALYTFIPRGLIAVESPKPRTETQEILFAYGNRLGGDIRSLDEAYPNIIQTLQDQAADRANTDKAKGVYTYADALIRLGGELEDFADVPSQATGAHARLASSYRDIGEKLKKIPSAQTDEAFIAAVTTYNAAMDVYTERYIALVNLFVAQGVVFSPGDPGSVFSFSAPTSFGF